jgi:hypothetical protein
LDETQAASRISETHSTGRKNREIPFSLQQPAENDTGRISSSAPEAGEGLTPEAFSRFFERDARRYGKGE